jgi:predicted dehydrogenase
LIGKARRYYNEQGYQFESLIRKVRIGWHLAYFLKKGFKMERVKLGIIGCGIAARTLHFPALQKLSDDYAVTAVCNHTEEKAREFAQLLGGVPYVLDYRELLDRTDVDAVVILLPVHLNYQVVMDAMAAGKHIMVEKPLAANLTEAGKLVHLAESYSKVTMVAENFHYRRQYKAVRLALESNVISAPYAVFWDCFKNVDPKVNFYAQTDWRIHHRYPGGFVTDGGVHYMAALRDLLGEIKPLAAFKKSVNAQIGSMDSLSLQFKAGADVHGVINLFFSANGFMEDRLVILGDNGSIVIENNRVTIQNCAEVVHTEEFPDDWGYVEEYQDFWRAVTAGSKVKSDFKEGYADFHAVIQALECAGAAQCINLVAERGE